VLGGARKGAILVFGITLTAVSLLGPIGHAVAQSTITIPPSTPSVATNSIPFGWNGWTPFAGFVYRNVPAFQLAPGDQLAFDAQGANDADIQLEIAMAPTTVNGGDVQAAAFTTIIPNTQLPAAPRGNAVVGDYDLSFTVPDGTTFGFAGGGLIIRFSNPGPALAADATSSGVTRGSNTGGFFVKRVYTDADGLAPWSGQDAINIGEFRLTFPARCRGEAATITGTDENDDLEPLRGTPGDDVIIAGDGNDVVFGKGGDDVVCGGNGRDEIIGGKGKDLLAGENGRDFLFGSGGKDKLLGGKGRDYLKGGKGKDKLKGGKGKDRIVK
jgi:Ca2+-binding RTX toxin-like protein